MCGGTTPCSPPAPTRCCKPRPTTAATPLLPGAEVLAFVDVDSTHRQVFGYGKQGAAVGRLKGTKTLHPLLATISTPIARPVIAGIRLRKGKSADVRGAAVMVAEALATAREAGCTGAIVVRGDSKFYTAEVVAAAFAPPLFAASVIFTRSVTRPGSPTRSANATTGTSPASAIKFGSSNAMSIFAVS